MKRKNITWSDIQDDNLQAIACILYSGKVPRSDINDSSIISQSLAWYRYFLEGKVEVTAHEFRES